MPFFPSFSVLMMPFTRMHVCICMRAFAGGCSERAKDYISGTTLAVVKELREKEVEKQRTQRRRELELDPEARS